jgi:hypothetical protein
VIHDLGNGFSAVPFNAVSSRTGFVISESMLSIHKDSKLLAIISPNGTALSTEGGHPLHFRGILNCSNQVAWVLKQREYPTVGGMWKQREYPTVGGMWKMPESTPPIPKPANKYARTIQPLPASESQDPVLVDVYSVLDAFGVSNPAIAHAVKKLLMPGARGEKSREQDLREAMVSVQRAIEMEAAQ